VVPGDQTLGRLLSPVWLADWLVPPVARSRKRITPVLLAGCMTASQYVVPLVMATFGSPVLDQAAALGAVKVAWPSRVPGRPAVFA